MSTFFKVQTGRNRGIMSFLKGDPSDRSPKRIIPVKTIGFYIVLLVGKVIFNTQGISSVLCQPPRPSFPPLMHPVSQAKLFSQRRGAL